jgi:hypothetical protein
MLFQEESGNTGGLATYVHTDQNDLDTRSEGLLVHHYGFCFKGQAIKRRLMVVHATASTLLLM